jgi:GMP synthase-like glutamine amidotransferase
MRLLVLQHVACEGPGSIALWADRHQHQLSILRVDQATALPALANVDWLVILGGPMGVWQEEHYPWLRDEKRFIRDFIATGKPVLGICLGAQLIAAALGASVQPHRQAEIGWFPVELTPAGASHPLLAGIQTPFTPLHWHGDTYALPQGAVQLAKSAACEQQAYAIGTQVLALQFHLEMRLEEVERLLAFTGDLPTGPWVMSATQLRHAGNLLAVAPLLFQLLDNMARIHVTRER